MPKKRKQKKNIPQDVTINDCANAVKPVTRVKKSAPADITPIPEVTWDQLQGDDFDIIEEIGADGTKSLVYKKKCNNSKNEQFETDSKIIYPEIVWYLISQFIKPEDVGRFAGINKTTYAITQRESFWRGLYNRYCQDHPKLPERLRLENSYRVYGIRQRVIRALYHTYSVFVTRVAQQSSQDSKPHQLVKHKCVNVWFGKGASHWCVYFKFRKIDPLRRAGPEMNFLQELGRVDANPEDGSQILEVTCQFFNEVPPIMGMTLSSVSIGLSRGFHHTKIHLGFNSGCHVSKNIQPECFLVLDTVKKIFVCDWWHPKYPHFDTTLRPYLLDDESLPVLENDFFMQDDDNIN